MTKFEPWTSGIEVSALQTEPQPLPFTCNVIVSFEML